MAHISFEKWILNQEDDSPCIYCDGHGDKKCPECNGTGEELVFTLYGKKFVTCFMCKGEKFVGCNPCNGTGSVLYQAYHQQLEKDQMWVAGRSEATR